MTSTCVATLRPMIGFAGTSDRLQPESVSSFAGICNEYDVLGLVDVNRL